MWGKAADELEKKGSKRKGNLNGDVISGTRTQKGMQGSAKKERTVGAELHPRLLLRRGTERR